MVKKTLGVPRCGWLDGPLNKIKIEKAEKPLEAVEVWNKTAYGEVDLKIQVLVDSIKAIDLKGEEVGLSQEDMTKRKDCFALLRHLLKSKDYLIF